MSENSGLMEFMSMNPGPIEEGGETVRTLISTMKESPLTLALVVFNMLFLTLVYYNARDVRLANERLVKELVADQSKTTDMLARTTELLSRIVIQVEERK